MADAQRAFSLTGPQERQSTLSINARNTCVASTIHRAHRPPTLEPSAFDWTCASASSNRIVKYRSVLFAAPDPSVSLTGRDPLEPHRFDYAGTRAQMSF